MNEFILTTTQKVLVSIEPVDKFGNPAPVENLAWATSDPTIVEIMDAEQPLQKWLVAKGALGPCQISVSADATIGEGEKMLTVVGTITVKPAEAISLGMKFGLPEEQ